MSINKANLIATVAENTGHQKTVVTDVLDAITATVRDAMLSGITVDIRGFIKLEPVNKPARTGRNPSTGVAIEIPAKTVVKATASKSLLCQQK